jgi:glutathione synthase/RimK-type ligase-like ATP-grasp enzyme
MSLAVAVQMDPIERIDIDADTTFVLALEAQRRGHGLYYYQPRQLHFRHGRVVADARPIRLRREPVKFSLRREVIERNFAEEIETMYRKWRAG